MPMDVGCETVKSVYEGSGDDAILQLGIDACAATEAARAAPPAERAMLLLRALDLRQVEFEAWKAFCTPEMPDGDKIGQSQAAMGIGNICLMSYQLAPLDHANALGEARDWYARADALLEGDESPAAFAQRQLVRKNGLALEIFAATRLLHKKVCVQGLVNKQHYNGRRGFVLNVEKPALYQVKLHATKENNVEVHLLVHEKNLVLV